MTNFIGKIKDWLNLGVIPLLGILVFTSLFLFLPDGILEKLSLFEIKNNYRIYFGLAFFFSISFLIASGVYNLWKIWLGPALKEHVSIYYYKKYARHLTNDEKEIIRTFINGSTRSATLSIQDPTVLGLERRKIIIRVGNIGATGFGYNFPFNIQPWAWEFYINHPEILE